MKVTTSSRKMKRFNDTMTEDPIGDEEIRAHYGIVEPLTGEELDNEVLKIQQQRNAAWAEANKK